MIDVRQRENIFNIPAHEKKVTSLRVDKESGSLISGSTDGQVKIWDINAIISIIPSVIASPDSFDASLISQVLEPPAGLKKMIPAVMQVEVDSNSIYIGDVEGLRRSLAIGK